TIEPATPAGALWIWSPVTVTAPENFAAMSKSTVPEVMFPLLSRTTWSQTMTFPLDVSAIGGVSLPACMSVRKGMVSTVSADNPNAPKNSPAQRHTVFLITKLLLGLKRTIKHTTEDKTRTRLQADVAASSHL